MPYLGDFLGLILEEITKSRVQADIETIRMAEMYAQDDLLKNMPVPRFRLPDLTFEIPIAIEGIEKDANVTGEELPDFGKMLSAFLEILSNRIKPEPFYSTIESNMEQLKKAISEKIEAIKKSPDESKNVKHVADLLIAEAGKTLTQLSGQIKQSKRFKDAIKKVLEDIRQPTYRVFNQLKPKPVPSPERVKIIATTSKLKEMAPDTTVSRLVLKIREEGMETILEESEDEDESENALSSRFTEKKRFLLTPE